MKLPSGTALLPRVRDHAPDLARLRNIGEIVGNPTQSVPTWMHEERHKPVSDRIARASVVEKSGAVPLEWANRRVPDLVVRDAAPAEPPGGARYALSRPSVYSRALERPEPGGSVRSLSTAHNAEPSCPQILDSPRPLRVRFAAIEEVEAPGGVRAVAVGQWIELTSRVSLRGSLFDARE
jgi:hypothetical protein